MTTLREAIQFTTTFLSASLATETGLPLVQRLHDTIPQSWTPPKPSLSQQAEVILYSLFLLKEIHTAVGSVDGQLGIKDWRQVNALVDIILALGLYKVLSPGVGVPESRRTKNVLLEREGQRVFSEDERRFLLKYVVSNLKGIVEQGGEIGKSLRGKHLVDILSGLTELAFSPSNSESERLSWNKEYEDFLPKLPLSLILTSLTALLHPQTPSWIRAPLTRELSSIPLQEDRHGVRTIVQFLLGKQRDPSAAQLDHIGKVIGSIPTWITAEEYIQRISSQVVGLLDERDILLQTSGVNIISFMIIHHAELVRQFILQSIQSPLLPSKDQMSEAISIISTDEAIENTLEHLAIITTNPSPQLISLLMQPLLLNLFLLAVYTKNTFHANLRAQTIRLLDIYFKFSSSSVADALHLVERLLWTATNDGWTYSAGDHGGVSIRRVESGNLHELGFDEILARVSTIIEITRGASDDAKSEIFVGIIRHWLSPDDENPLSAFANAQLLQEFLSSYETELLKSPLSIIQVCAEILSNYNTMKTTFESSITNLSQIVKDPDDDDEDDSFLELALNLLSTITAESVQREITPDEISAYKTCLLSLESIVTATKNPAHRTQARNVISFIRARIAMTSPTTEKPPQSDQDVYNQAIEYISDPLVPVRAQGISILRDLILRKSPIVNIHSILDLLINLLQDDDSYVYLNAIKAIQTLADAHGEQITRKLMNQYESNSLTVDERIRIAESLAGVIQRLNELFTGQFAQEIISRGISLVSTEKDWKLRVSAIGLVSVCVEVSPSSAEPAIEMALHLFRVNDLSFAEEGEGAAPLRRGAVAVIAGVLRSGGIDALGRYTKGVLRNIKYLARSDGDETVKELARGVMDMLNGVIETEGQDTKWNVGRKIQEL